MPGLIDAHVHINEPGRTDWEGFETATQSAAAGGITTVIDMPLNSSPVTINTKAFREKINATKDKLHVNVGFYGGLVPENEDSLEPLLNTGVLGIKCFLVHSGIDEFPNVEKSDIEFAMPILKKYQLPLLAHCEIFQDENYSGFSQNRLSYKHYLASRPKEWENNAVNMMIGLCRRFNCPTHIVHVSSSETLMAIAEAKKEGLPLTAETCPHYIYFNAEDIMDGNAIFKCAPPIRERENNTLLKQALANGVIDFITTDHSPASPSIKQIESGNLESAWGGIAGLQFLLPASWSSLKEIVSLEQFIPMVTERPARFLKLHQRKGFIKVGFDADLVLWEPKTKQTILAEDILFRHKISPYIGVELTGKVQQTIVNGVSVFKNNRMSDRNIKNGQVILSNHYNGSTPA